MSPEKLRERQQLANGLCLEVWDRSRPVAGDRWQVVLEARIRVPVTAGNLPPELRREKGAVAAALGPEVVFCRREERNFIAVGEVTEIIKEMESRLQEQAATYLGHREFAPRFLRRKYAEYQEKQGWQRH